MERREKARARDAPEGMAGQVTKALRYTIAGRRHYVVDTNNQARLGERLSMMEASMADTEPEIVDVEIIEMGDGVELPDVDGVPV